MSLNGKKTYYIIFNRARIKLMSHTSDLYMGDSILTATNKLKYHGVIIDDKITWIPHITCVKNKASKCIGITLSQEKFPR